MGIFSKKTNEPIDSDDLAKKVEEYNRKYVASQEESKPSTNIASSNLVDIDGIQNEIVDVAGKEITIYVFRDMSENAFSDDLKSAFTDYIPSRKLLTTVAQCYKIGFSTAFDDKYNREDRYKDTEKLKQYVIAHSRKHVYILGVLAHAPIFLGSKVASVIKFEQGCTDEQALSQAAEALDGSLVELREFALGLLKNA